MEDGVHEVAGAVSGEGAAGSVGAVGSGGEAEDEDACARISEAGNGARPVDVILVSAAPGFADVRSVFAQAGAELATDDRVTNAVQIGGRGG